MNQMMRTTVKMNYPDYWSSEKKMNYPTMKTKMMMEMMMMMNYPTMKTMMMMEMMTMMNYPTMNYPGYWSSEMKMNYPTKMTMKKKNPKMMNRQTMMTSLRKMKHLDYWSYRMTMS